jgi:hypothetical protein
VQGLEIRLKTMLTRDQMNFELYLLICLVHLFTPSIESVAVFAKISSVHGKMCTLKACTHVYSSHVEESMLCASVTLSINSRPAKVPAFRVKVTHSAFVPTSGVMLIG